MKMAQLAMHDNLSVQDVTTSPSTVSTTSPAIGSPYSSAASFKTHFSLIWDDRLEAPKYIVGPSRSLTSRKTTSSVSSDDAAPTQSRASKKQKPAQPKAKPGELFFFNMSDPSRPIPKSDLRPIRQHVMKRWLEKNQGDGRTKRKRNDSAFATNKSSFTRGQSQAIPSAHDKDASASRQTACDGTIKVKTISEDAVDNIEECVDVVGEINRYIWQGFPDLIYRPVHDDGRSMLYLATPIFQTFLPNDGVSGKINPFKAWPIFPRPDLEVETLQYSCIHRFGTEGMASRWLPTMMKTKHAFYSTICMSAAHDDVMKSELGIENPIDSKRRAAIRESILQMITESMQDAVISDGTIIAVLHVLYGEMISGDPELIGTNHSGLDIMVTTRGGLDGLGVHGALATVVTSTMHLMGILLEEVPKAKYTSYAKMIVTEPPPSDQYIPESPIYTVTGFAVPPQAMYDPVQKMLEYASEATGIFGARYKIAPQSSVPQDLNETVASEMLRSMHDRIFSYQKVECINLDAKAGTIEAVRLATQTFVRALLLKMPISQAARLLEQEQAQEFGSTLPIQVQIKDALKQTCIDDCWGSRSGTLLWIGLVALASANRRGDLEQDDDADLRYTTERARRWLTAIVIRCSTLQSFEYTQAFLGMLKRFVAIQQVLDEGRQIVEPTKQTMTNLTLQQTAMSNMQEYGPFPLPGLQQTTVKDFVWQTTFPQQGYV